MEYKPLIRNEGIDEKEIDGSDHNQITTQTRVSSDRVLSCEQGLDCHSESHRPLYNNLNSDCDTVVIINNINTASTSLSSQISVEETMSRVRSFYLM